MSSGQKSVAIVGAGLTGPTAALALANSGFKVTVFDQRPESALYSTGIVGIRRGNCRNLASQGVDLSTRLKGKVYHDYSYGETRLTRTPFYLFAWTDLHNAIVHAAMDAGAVFRYETPVQSNWHPDLDGGYRHLNADFTIDAGGSHQRG